MFQNKNQVEKELWANWIIRAQFHDFRRSENLTNSEFPCQNVVFPVSRWANNVKLNVCRLCSVCSFSVMCYFSEYTKF